MRKLLLLLSIFVMLLSCDLEISDNGNLDGFWQLRSIDSLQNGKSVDMRESGVYWGVQTDLLEARSVDIGVFFRFSLVGDSLFLCQPYINNRDSADISVVDAAVLAPLGINRLDEHFRVLKLERSTMVLQSEILRLYFRKY